jgi:hypothetical protein
MSTSEQVRSASDEVARNIASYLEQNSPELAHTTRMQMYDEQFEKQDQASGSAAQGATAAD